MNDTQTDIIETFRFSTTPELDTTIESERHAPAFNSRIAVHAFYASKHISHFEVDWQNGNQDAVHTANAQYQFTTDKIIVNRSIDGQAFLETLSMPEVLIVLPLLRIFTGKAIRQAFEIGNGERVPIFIPNIKDAKDKTQLLTLELDMRSANLIEQDTININNKEHPADVFNFIGGNYDHTAKFWVAENDLLLQYQWQQNNVFWEVKLVEVN